MLKRSIPGVLLLFVSITVLLLTLVNLNNETIIIPFSMSSGESGTIKIQMPLKVWTGDQFTFSSRVVFESLPESPSPVLVGRLETSVEESIPRGEVMLGLNSKKPVTLEWSLRPYQNTVYPGTFWLWMNTGDQEKLLLAREFSISSQYFMGVKIMYVRIAAILVAVAALICTLYSFSKRK